MVSAPVRPIHAPLPAQPRSKPLRAAALTRGTAALLTPDLGAPGLDFAMIQTGPATSISESSQLGVEVEQFVESDLVLRVAFQSMLDFGCPKP